MDAKIAQRRDNWSYFPIKHKELEDLYQAQLAAFWTKGDLLFTDSGDDMALLDEEQKKLLYGVLSIFSQIDGLVGEKVDGFTDHHIIKEYKEALSFFRIQNAIENVHNEVYGLMIIHYIQNEKERHKILHAATEIPVVKKLADWLEKETQTDILLKKIFVNALTEGVMFQGLFGIIFWFRKTFKGKFIGLTVGNEMISRDEELHATFACVLFMQLKRDFIQSGIQKECVDWANDRKELVRMIEEMIEILSEFYQYIHELAPPVRQSRLIS
jgi:ribonucleotide reductase beta subunit family protein with ferritin-like domain